MPFAPVAAILVPKASAAVATAFAAGGDDLAHHAQDLVHHAHDNATAFLHLPTWASAKLSALFGAGAIPPEQQGHMVDYYAASCGHCKHLEPVWKDATGLWTQQAGADANQVVWEQKQCYDDHWKPGPDYEECKAQGIEGFPSIKFFGPGSKTGQEFDLDRTPEQLVNFAQTGMAPGPVGAAGDQHGHMVEYSAVSCPHCKLLDPIWKDASGLWAKQAGADADQVVWEQKQCYDENWKPGPDYQECKAQGIEGYPAIKFFPPGSKTGQDFTLDRTADSLLNFAKTALQGADSAIKTATMPLPLLACMPVRGKPRRESVPAPCVPADFI